MLFHPVVNVQFHLLLISLLSGSSFFFHPPPTCSLIMEFTPAFDSHSFFYFQSFEAAWFVVSFMLRSLFRLTYDLILFEWVFPVLFLLSWVCNDPLLWHFPFYFIFALVCWLTFSEGHCYCSLGAPWPECGFLLGEVLFCLFPIPSIYSLFLGHSVIRWVV